MAQAVKRVAPADTHVPSLIDELNDAVSSHDIKRRLKIILRISDLFSAGSRHYSREQIALFDDLLRQLADEIEVQARAELSRRLARMEEAPPKLVRSLAGDDEISVAAPMLTHSQQLTDEDLVAYATVKSQDHLLAIAERLSLSESVTDVLVDRGDTRVVNKVAKNKGAHFSLAGYGKLTQRAEGDSKLALALGRRNDLPRQYFLKLVETASASVRARLEADNPHAVDAVRDTVDTVATALQREARDASSKHAVAARDVKKRMRVSAVTEASVHGPARAQDFERTVLALATLGQFPIDLVERALLDEGEDMLLLFAKAAGCSWTTARELLQMYAAKRVLTPDDLARSFERYKKLSQKTAQSIVRFHERTRGGAPAPAEEIVQAMA